MRDWDDVAHLYALQEPLERASWTAALRLALPEPGEVVLDLGCGPGTLVRELRRAGMAVPRRLLGVDPAPGMLARARRAGLAPVRAAADRVPLASSSVDLALCCWLLHLLPAASRRQALSEIARVLGPTGRAVVVVPAAPAHQAGRVVRRIARACLARGGDALTVPDDLDTAVASAGLVVRADLVTRRGYSARVLLLSGSA